MSGGGESWRAGRCSLAVAGSQRAARDPRGRAHLRLRASTPELRARVEVHDPRAYAWSAARQHRARRGLRRGPVDGRRPRRPEPDRLPQPRRPRPPAPPPAAAARPAAARPRTWSRATPAPARATNISAHYDLGNTLFEAFLDERMMYSAAVFPEPGRDPRAGAAGEARADLRRARARPRRPPARDRHRLGRARGARRGDARLPGDDDDDLARATRLRRRAGARGGPRRTGSRS